MPPLYNKYDDLNDWDVLATLWIQQGKNDEAIALLKDLCQRGSKLGFEDRFNYISIQQKLAMAYLAAGENRLAIEHLERILNDFYAIDKTGEEDLSAHERILLDSLAKAYMRGMELEKAASTFERSLPICIESLGESHPITIQGAIFLSKIHASLGNTERSKELIEQFGLNDNDPAEDAD